MIERIREWLGERRSGSWAAAWLAAREDTLVGGRTLQSAYQQVAVVYACVTYLAECVSSVPIAVFENGVRRKTLPDILGKPHPQMNWLQFIELVVIWLCLRGEAFIVPSKEGVSGGCFVLDPSDFREIVAHGALQGWGLYVDRNRVDVGKTVLLPEEVIHIRLPNPFDLFRGCAPLSAAMLPAETDFAASQFTRGSMLNNADTGLIVTGPEGWEPTPEQKERILSALRERKRSAGVADQPLLLFGGLKVDKPSISVADFNLLGQRQYSRREICAVFRVPEQLLGFNEDSNRSVSETMRIAFFENRILPLCNRLAPELDKLVPGMEFKFMTNEHPVMQEARRERVKVAKDLHEMGMELHAISEYLDLDLPV